jgi:hypothetical protein
LDAALSPQQIAWFSQAVAAYIHEQRGSYYERCKPLSFGPTWAGYFSPLDLNRLRIIEPGPERVANPPFYAELERLGFTSLPNFSTMAAITFDDVVVFHDPLTPQLIFHELVHVTQYRLLGIEEFARLYVIGYLHGGYEGTPLERCAYDLDGRFIMGGRPFNVEAEISSWIESGRF